MRLNYIADSLFNSYAVVFFSNSRVVAILLMLVSFLNPLAGLSGLIAVITALLILHIFSFNKESIRRGLYSFNALLVGIGMGSFFETGTAFFLLLLLAALFTVIFSIVLESWLGKYGLPFLSIPFIIVFSMMLLSAREFAALGMAQKNVTWLVEMYVNSEETNTGILSFLNQLQLPYLAVVYFKALSAIFFQTNVLAGMIIALAILYHSRIAFSLTVIGFIAAYLFFKITAAHSTGINYYNLGSNYMLTAVAVGCFFLIPSVYSYLWAIISVPLSYLIVIAAGKTFGLLWLPVFSLPFCLVVILIIYFLKLRPVQNKVQLTVIQLFSPEENLYSYVSGKNRLQYVGYIQLKLPFIGEWMVSQGYDGGITHKGEWSKALDFVITDRELKTYTATGTDVTHYYCYNKPVLAPADGFVEEIYDEIDDNAIGKVNTQQNWGNTIIIRHAPYLFSKLSHLKKHSFRYRKGDFVRQGDIVANCGSSGRSPEPHLHFQLQSTPYIGSKTLAYPLSYFVTNNNNKSSFVSWTNPQEGTLVSNLSISVVLQKAFAFQPGFKLYCNCNGVKESWEVFTSAFNETYVYCAETKSTMYFINDGNSFFATGFYGNRKSLLYFLYKSAYRIMFSSDKGMIATDAFPLHETVNKRLLWVQDFFAPFYIFRKNSYESTCIAKDDVFATDDIKIVTKEISEIFGKAVSERNAVIQIQNGQIHSIEIHSKKKNLIIQCTLEE